MVALTTLHAQPVPMTACVAKAGTMMAHRLLKSGDAIVVSGPMNAGNMDFSFSTGSAFVEASSGTTA
eukprot:CAMPEP_0205940396 /NCGR_PEP_ID=MMETSP1325-20131115/52276_1 /ASSEMBLY_ACC=CAM_ASM_000708 /TAXON_ID=236786 /ORGANISM="Florenciella sp., Strain RCC1007" /LENGTH=66 /DNA_ID=CAMNT_0053310943 /DNA_START=51 /DNA_END=247 /DNA_ORIENTATION=+